MQKVDLYFPTSNWLSDPIKEKDHTGKHMALLSMDEKIRRKENHNTILSANITLKFIDGLIFECLLSSFTASSYFPTQTINLEI